MNLVIAAAQAAQEGDTQRAAELLKESQKAIDDVVSPYIQDSLYLFKHVDMIPGRCLGLHLRPTMW